VLSRIRAALETHDDVGIRRKKIDDLPLPFVAELTADGHGGGHGTAGNNVPVNLRVLSRPCPRTRRNLLTENVL